MPKKMSLSDYDSIIGQKFGKLTVLKMDKINVRRITAVVECECGNERIVSLGHLRNGHTQSCGCFRIIVTGRLNFSHGLRHHPLYDVWSNMKARCYNKKSENYRYYGGSGIIVCLEWKKDFKAFYDWAMSNGFEAGLEIDRFPNKKGNYEPNNCRWATKFQQSYNKSNNVTFSLDSKEYTIHDLSKMSGIKMDTISDRIYNGWDIQRAVSQAPRIDYKP